MITSQVKQLWLFCCFYSWHFSYFKSPCFITKFKEKNGFKSFKVGWTCEICLLSVSQGKTIIGHRTLQHLIAFLESSALHTLCTQQQQQRVSIEEAEGLILSKQPKIPSPLYSAAVAAAATTTRLYSAIFERFFMQNCKRTNVNNGKLALKYSTTIFLSNQGGAISLNQQSK